MKQYIFLTLWIVFSVTKPMNFKKFGKELFNNDLKGNFSIIIDFKENTTTLKKINEKDEEEKIFLNEDITKNISPLRDFFVTLLTTRNLENFTKNLPEIKRLLKEKNISAPVIEKLKKVGQHLKAEYNYYTAGLVAAGLAFAGYKNRDSLKNFKNYVLASGASVAAYANKDTLKNAATKIAEKAKSTGEKIAELINKK